MLSGGLSMLPLSVMMIGFLKLTKLFLTSLAQSSKIFHSISSASPFSFINQTAVYQKTLFIASWFNLNLSVLAWLKYWHSRLVFHSKANFSRFFIALFRASPQKHPGTYLKMNFFSSKIFVSSLILSSAETLGVIVHF